MEVFYLNLTYILEIIGTIAFAFVGAQIAIDLNLDFLGIYISGLSTAVGGGMIRDIILGNTPPALFRNVSYCICAFITITIMILAYKVLKDSKFYQSLLKLIVIADALGLGIFTVVGMDIAISVGFYENGLLTVFSGVITAVGGGLLRDTMINRTPTVLSKEIYATAAIVGGIVYYFMLQFFSQPVSTIAAVIIITGVRLFAVRKNLNLPYVMSNGEIYMK